jgi:purine-cytosine permease-like protein
MSEARKDPAEAHGADAVPGDAVLHDDDELAAALQAQLERFAPSGSIPVITPERVAEYDSGRAGSPPALPGSAGSAAGAPRAGAGSFGDAGERLPSVSRPTGAPAAADPSPATGPTETGSMRRPQWPTFAQVDGVTHTHAAVSPPGTARQDASSLPAPAGRHTGGGARVPARTGPVSVPERSAPSPAAETAPAPPPTAAPAPVEHAAGPPSSRSDLRFSSPVPHFDPPPLPVPAAPLSQVAPDPEPLPEVHQVPPAGDAPDPLEVLERLQPRLAQVRLDPRAAIEWEQSLRRIAETPPPELPPIVPPAPAAPAPAPDAARDDQHSARWEPHADLPDLPFLSGRDAPSQAGPAPSALPLGNVAAVPVGSDLDEDVVHAELVDDDDEAAAPEAAAPEASAGEDLPHPGSDDIPVGVPAVLGHSGPVPATGATALTYPLRPGTSDEAPAGDPGEVAPLAVDGITTDTGALNTGSLPIMTTSALDRDLDDDVDDIVAPQELLLHVGTTGEVGIVGAGPDTGQVAPVASTSVRTGMITLPTPEQAAPSPFGVEVADLAPIDEDQRLRRPVSQFWLWLAPNSSALTLALGATLVAFGISFRQAIVAAVVGVVAACLTLAVGVLAAKRTGQPVAVVSRAVFGLRGNLLPTIVLLLVRLFWAAILAWIAAEAVRSVLSSTGWDTVLSAETGGAIAAVILPVVACLIAVFGHGLLARVHLVLGALSAVLVILLLVLTAPLLDFTTVLATPDGAPLRLVGAAVAVLSLLAVAWASSGGELARYQNPGTSGTATAGWAALGAALPALALTVWGVLLASSAGTAQAGALSADPIAALLDRLPAWYPVPFLLAVLLGLVAALATVLYSTGLTLGAVGIRVHRAYRTIAAAGIAVAAGIALLLVGAPMTALLGGLVPVLAVPVVAWTGILAAEFFLRTGPFDTSSLLQRGGRYPDVRWGTFAALAVISVLGIGLVGGDGFAGMAGYLWRLFGIGQDSALAQADLGVPLALVLGLLTPLVLGRAELRRQEERAPVVATLTE